MFTLLRPGRHGQVGPRYTPLAATSPLQNDGSTDHERDDSPARSPGGSLIPPSRRRTSRHWSDRRQEQINDELYQDANEGDDEDGDNEDDEHAPLLPIFSAAHLDRLPLYNITHAIRLLIVQKCETTLSWDQLRSPQVSQFLVKPIQTQIRQSHFNRATLCALIANNLQFQKEGQANPANVGVCNTRALISELLAMRLIKEYHTRELIDALSYDFDPLQGMDGPASVTAMDLQARRMAARGARVSTIEIAIRAQAKRFLSHATVVQHLEAIWAGSIVFHSEADNLHRKSRAAGTRRGYGTIRASLSSARKSPSTEHGSPRRSVTLYNPRDASLFKLSRLRVPRYRQVLTTLSFAMMLALFIAVLVERSQTITPLEILFWFWLAGYMLDEIVGFTEQGFGLYILSFWNAFDLGILLLFVAYLALRLSGLVIADSRQHRISKMAFDVLASTAVLLFPRLFSVLDHYRYFSQLLIAFRLMAVDLIAVLVLILISCSGFFVAFTLSFSEERMDWGTIAYALFQILMGFTPAAWERWETYNPLGRIVLVAFLIICHFLIVTILITVLTNSFMAVVRNANEEHQFLFAVNTISMVKSDALFSYIAPSNVIGWAMSPLRFVIPFRQYVKVNRYIIKVSHFPVLLAIFAYERVILTHFAFQPIDLVEKQNLSTRQPVAFRINKAVDVLSSGQRLREPSVISFHKDQALEEVFRRPFRGSTIRTTIRDTYTTGRRNSTNVDKWMEAADEEGGASPPLEQPRSVLEQLEERRPTIRRSAGVNRFHKHQQKRDILSAAKSVTSDPDYFSRGNHRVKQESDDADVDEGQMHETDAEGDDENNDESDHPALALGESAVSVAPTRSPRDDDSDTDEYFHTPTGMKSPHIQLSNAAQLRLRESPQTSIPQQRGIPHQRQSSNATILFAPDVTYASSTSGRPLPRPRATDIKRNVGSRPLSPKYADALAVPRMAKAKVSPSRTRPILPPRQNTAPQALGMNYVNLTRRAQRQPSFNARALDLASEIGDNKWGPSGLDAGGISGMPASFSEQLFRERELERQREADRRRSEEEEKGMVNRIMLARMHTLEEGFREVLREIKDLSQHASSRRESDMDVSGHPAAGPSGLRARLADHTGGSSAGSQSPNLSQTGAFHVAPARPRTPGSKLMISAERKRWARKGSLGKRPTSSKGKEPSRPQGSEQDAQNDGSMSPKTTENVLPVTNVPRPSTAVRTPHAANPGEVDEEKLG